MNFSLGENNCEICGNLCVKNFYKCLNCNFYLCGLCLEKKNLNLNHKLYHLIVKFDEKTSLYGLNCENDIVNLDYIKQIFRDKVHNDMQCSSCGQEPIQGIRLKCNVCYNYDLCFKCFNNKKETKEHKYEIHPMVIEDRDSFKINLNDIEFGDMLGEGGFGKVYKVKFKSTGKIAACKIIENNNRNKLISFIRELDALNELNSENVIKMIGRAIKDTRYYLFTEYMERGNLSNFLKNEKNLSFEKKFRIALDITNALVRIHDKKIIHRDVRPENILIDVDLKAKISDFGIAKYLGNNNKECTATGALQYMPEEFFKKDIDNDKKITTKFDIFTFGLTLIEIFDGKYFNIAGVVTIRQKPTHFNDLIEKCIERDSSKRPDAKKIFQYFKRYSGMCKNWKNK